MAFHEPKDMKKARKKPRTVKGQNMYQAQFHIFHSFPEHAQRSAPLKEVTEFDYLGLRLDPFLTMNSALLLVLDKVNKSHALVAAVSYSLRYAKGGRCSMEGVPRYANAQPVEGVRSPAFPTVSSVFP
jgi:hypothetical protein